MMKGELVLKAFQQRLQLEDSREDLGDLYLQLLPDSDSWLPLLSLS
jgi:hypothetical protein